jgi:hypothetical protein
MPLRIPADLIAIFGSETRVRVLAALAGAYAPMTAYRVGKVGEVPLPKAYEEVRRLAQAGSIVRKGPGWVLRDEDIRHFMRKRLRVVSWDDWWNELDRTAARRHALLRRSMARPLPRFSTDWKPRTPVRRDPRKDALLREAGLRTTAHG